MATEDAGIKGALWPRTPGSYRRGTEKSFFKSHQVSNRMKSSAGSEQGHAQHTIPGIVCVHRTPGIHKCACQPHMSSE